MVLGNVTGASRREWENLVQVMGGESQPQMDRMDTDEEDHSIFRLFSLAILAPWRLDPLHSGFFSA